MIIELDTEETQMLNLVLGIATGAAMKTGRTQLADAIVALANRIHRNNPNWTPYGTEAQKNTNPARH